MARRQVLLFSGGLDSAAAWWVLGKPDWLHFPFNRPRKGELAAIERMGEIAPEFRERGKIVEIDWEPWQRRVERSDQLLSGPREALCAVLAWARGYDECWTGWHWDDRTMSSDFAQQPGVTYPRLDHTENAGPTGQYFVLRHPIQSMGLRRADLIRAAIRAGAPSEFLMTSLSCHVNDEQHCGLCQNCVERWLAFRAAGVEDLTEYAAEIEPLKGLRIHLSDPVYEQHYRTALGLDRDTPITLDDTELPDLNGFTRFQITTDKSVMGLSAVPVNGARISSLVLGLAGRLIYHTVYQGAPTSLQMLLTATRMDIGDDKRLLALGYGPSQIVDVYVKMESGKIENFEAH